MTPIDPSPAASSYAPTAPLMAVGTFVVDYHKALEHYPAERAGARVKRELVSHGGAPLNLLVTLAKLGVTFPLHAAAKVGRDLDGKFILDCCKAHHINTTQIHAIDGASTGYTDVYTVETNGRHTCFHYSGIGDTFSRNDVKLRAAMPKILFLGSLGALGKMDNTSARFGRSGASQLVRDARKQGITTVLEISPIDRAASIEPFRDTLAQADFLVINDRTAEQLTGIELHDEGRFEPDLARATAKQILRTGLRRGIVIHARAGACLLDADGTFHQMPGYFLPAAERKGSAGVDHAFTAGFIEGLYHARPVPQCLDQGLAVATLCRRHITPSDAIEPLDACLQFCHQLHQTTP